MRTNTTRQPATQPAFGRCPVGFALFRPVAVRCVPLRCGAVRCGAFRSGRRRHLWWGGGGVGGGGGGPALPVALVPKWASAMLRALASRQSLQVLRLRWSGRGRLRSGVRRGMSAALPCGCQAPWPLGTLAALPFSGAGSPSSQPLEASPLRLVALSRPQRLWPRRPSARKRASGGQDGATLRRQGNQHGALWTREP